MYFEVFHPEVRRAFRGTRGKKSEFGHSFGTDVRYEGLKAVVQRSILKRLTRRQAPVHVLFRLDTTDPAIGVKIPSTRWLPLLCAIRYGACDLGYKVISDNEVRILYQHEAEAWADFPYSRFPDRLAPQPLSLEERLYDPGKVEDGLFYARVFGFGALSPDQYAALVRQIEEEQWYVHTGWNSAEDYLKKGHALPFVQGKPTEDCPDTSCRNHGKRESLQTLAIFVEDAKEYRKLWGPNGENLQITFQICPLCQAIRSTNQCT